MNLSPTTKKVLKVTAWIVIPGATLWAGYELVMWMINRNKQANTTTATEKQNNNGPAVVVVGEVPNKFKDVRSGSQTVGNPTGIT